MPDFLRLAFPMLVRGMHKTSIYVGSNALLFAAIMAKLRSAMDKVVPVGYQDDSGFHIGEEPAPKRETWPTTDTPVPVGLPPAPFRPVVSSTIG